MVFFMKIFASSLPTHCQDCIEPVPVPLCALYHHSTTWGLAWCLIFEWESQHHVFKTPCNSHGIVFAARERWLLFRLPKDDPVYCQLHCSMGRSENRVEKNPRLFFSLVRSPSVHRNKCMLQRVLGEHVSLEMQRNTTDFLSSSSSSLSLACQEAVAVPSRRPFCEHG